MSKRKSATASTDPVCECGHPKSKHMKPDGCLHVDLNAGGRFMHHFCCCPKFVRAKP